MLSKNIIYDEIEVEDELSIFRIPLEALLRVAYAAYQSRVNVNKYSARNAKGTYSYHVGLVALRDVFIQYGWLKYDNNGIEGVRCPNTGIVVLFQNVDVACNLFRDPQNISPKKEGSQKLIDVMQTSFFDILDEGRSEIPYSSIPLNKQVWYYCFSTNSELINAELSLPVRLDNGRFKGFVKRIFLIQSGELVIDDGISEPPFEIVPEIKRK